MPRLFPIKPPGGPRTPSINGRAAEEHPKSRRRGPRRGRQRCVRRKGSAVPRNGPLKLSVLKRRVNKPGLNHCRHRWAGLRVRVLALVVLSVKHGGNSTHTYIHNIHYIYTVLHPTVILLLFWGGAVGLGYSYLGCFLMLKSVSAFLFFGLCPMGLLEQRETTNANYP